MKKLLANKDIVYREEEDGAILFDPGDRVIQLLNKTANLVWKLCDGTRTQEMILAELKKTFPKVNKEVLEKDLEDFLSKAKESSTVKLV